MKKSKADAKTVLLFCFFRSIMLSENSVYERGIPMKKSTGKQIQSIADLLFGLGCICAVLAGLIFFSADNYLVGIIIIVLGCYSAWATTRFLVGFGELVDDAAASRESIDRIVDILESHHGFENDNHHAIDADDSTDVFPSTLN